MQANSNEFYEKRLDEAIETIKNCQKEHRLKSCSACEQYIDCELRQSYIKVVYESMSKGEIGGFEF